MRAMEELEVQGEEPPVPWWEAAPFHGTPQGWSHFASVLSTVSAAESGPALGDEAEDEDAASLSYESALRAQACSRLCREPASAADSRAEDSASDAGGFEVAHSTGRQEGANRRPASVTIRLSEEENQQLRRRAAEAGLTVSAYLRSCTFEAEALRARVKEVLAQLRAASGEKRPPSGVSSHAARRWWQIRTRREAHAAQA